MGGCGGGCELEMGDRVGSDLAVSDSIFGTGFEYLIRTHEYLNA